MPTFHPKIDEALKDQAILDLRNAINSGHITETQRNAAIDANSAASQIAKFARALDGSIEDQKSILTDIYTTASDSARKSQLAAIASREAIATLEPSKLNAIFEQYKSIVLESLNTMDGNMRKFASVAAGSGATDKGEFIQSLLQHYDLKTDFGSNTVIVNKDNTQEGPNPGYALPKAVSKVNTLSLKS